MEHIATNNPTIYGMIAEFSEPEQIVVAATKARSEGYRRMDAYTPYPIHGLDEALDFHDARVPWMIFGFGVLGAAFGYGMQYFTSTPTLEGLIKKFVPITFDVGIRNIPYAMNVGGRPFHSWPSFIPVAYECTILFAGLSAVFGTLILCGFPKLYHPIFNAKNIDRASVDKYFLCIEATDPKFDLEDTEIFLKSLGADSVSEVAP